MSATKDSLHHPVTALTLSQSEAIVAVFVGAVAVDGVLGTEEARRLNDVLATSRWMLGISTGAVAGAAKQGLDLIASHGLPAVLNASTDAIPPDLRATTFALAVDLVLADGRLGTRENTFIDELQAALEIEGSWPARFLTCC